MNTYFSPPNILIVDDVNTNLAVLTEIIHKAGFIARPVTSARQAVSAIEVLRPDLILMDISMPEIDGYVFCSMLKKNANTREIPVVFISALNTAQDRIKGFKAGAVDFITKPYETEELVLRVNTHLKMYKKQQELETYNKNLNKIINDQIRKIYEEQKNVVQALIKVVYQKRSDDKYQMELVTKNSRILALSLQMSPKYRDQITNSFIEAIELAAPFYNMGVDILEEIYAVNKNNEFLKMAVEVSKYHYENWDGSGFPHKLQGTDIPLSARIVAIIDAYMSSEIHMNSVQNIRNGNGTLYDPDIVEVFQKIHNQLNTGRRLDQIDEK